MKGVVSKIGDIYLVTMPDGTKKYFQYIADDMTMLNSRVIRVFKKTYPAEYRPDLKEIINDEVDFYTHVVIKWGVQMNLWEKIGHFKDKIELNVIFRDTDDIPIMKPGDKMVEISERWKVWRINEPMQFVGKLEGKNREAEIGHVKSPDSVLERIWTGKYNMSYPGYDEKSVLRYTPTREGEMIKNIIEKARESRK